MHHQGLLLPVPLQAFCSTFEEMKQLELFHLGGSFPNARNTACALGEVKLNSYRLNIYPFCFYIWITGDLIVAKKKNQNPSLLQSKGNIYVDFSKSSFFFLQNYDVMFWNLDWQPKKLPLECIYLYKVLILQMAAQQILEACNTEAREPWISTCVPRGFFAEAREALDMIFNQILNNLELCSSKAKLQYGWELVRGARKNYDM